GNHDRALSTQNRAPACRSGFRFGEKVHNGCGICPELVLHSGRSEVQSNPLGRRRIRKYPHGCREIPSHRADATRGSLPRDKSSIHSLAADALAGKQAPRWDIPFPTAFANRRSLASSKSSRRSLTALRTHSIAAYRPASDREERNLKFSRQ